MTKPMEYYIALAAGMGFVVLQHKGKRAIIRTAIAGISGGFGYAMAPDIALYLERSETLTVALTTAFVYIVFDTAGSIIADRDAIMGALKARMGGRK